MRRTRQRLLRTRAARRLIRWAVSEATSSELPEVQVLQVRRQINDAEVDLGARVVYRGIARFEDTDGTKYSSNNGVLTVIQRVIAGISV